MPRRKWIDKHQAQTFQLLYRSQDDPLLNDDNTDERALFPVSGPGPSSKHSYQARGLHLADLEDDLDFEQMRENEGEAAQYGIYYDDTNYDYMQHLRDIDQGSAEAHFVDDIPVKVVNKGKGKAKAVRLEDALREVSLEESNQDPSLMDRASDDGLSTFSRTTRPRTYQSQQDVPDEIAGFQPDLDPRLRETLDALDDDAYVDEEDEDDVFSALINDGRNGELDLQDFEATIDEDDEGWESDATERAPSQSKELKLPEASSDGVPPTQAEFDATNLEKAAAVAEDGDWLRDFTKYKRESSKRPAPQAANSIIAASAIQDKAPTLYTLNGTPIRQKKRKGALTNPSAYSMTSSSLARTEGQQILDARFDQVEKMYALDEDDELDDEDGGMSIASGMTKQSKMSTLSTTSFADEGAVSKDLDGMMDGFLSSWNNGNPAGGKRMGAKGKRGKNGNEAFGLKQLDEVRAELGRGRIYT